MGNDVPEECSIRAVAPCPAGQAMSIIKSNTPKSCKVGFSSIMLISVYHLARPPEITVLRPYLLSYQEYSSQECATPDIPSMGFADDENSHPLLPSSFGREISLQGEGGGGEEPVASR